MLALTVARVLAMTLLISSFVEAQLPIAEHYHELSPLALEQNSLFGSQILADSETLIVSAPGFNPPGLPGQVYVLEPTLGGWGVRQQICPRSSTGADRFGLSLDVEDGLLAVGAPDSSAAVAVGGAAFVYERIGSRWFESVELTASNAEPFDDFGHDVAVSGQWIAVSAPTADVPSLPGSTDGAVYLYRFDGTSWIEDSILTADPASASSRFGLVLGIRNGLLVITSALGVLHFFELIAGDWELRQVVVPSVPTGSGEIEFDGNQILIGAESDATQGVSAGAVQVFELQGSDWVLADMLFAASGAEMRRFGEDIALSDDRLAVSAGTASGAESNTGVVHLFERDASGWVEFAILAPADSLSGDLFGQGLAILGQNVVVGAPGRDGDSPSEGLAYFFQTVEQPFVRGDSNEDGVVDISDVVFTLSALFMPDSPESNCSDTRDVNDDGAVDVSDPIALLAGIFGAGPPIPSPVGTCGIDPTEDSLPCQLYDSCQ